MNPVFVVLLLSVYEATAQVTCDNGGIYSEQFEKCYKFMDIPLGQDDARQVCEGMGSSLVSIKNAFEQQFVYTQAKKILLTEQFWTGGNDLTTQDVWKWPDSSSLFYTNWQDGYPTNDANARCVAVEPSKGKWLNVDCSMPAKFVCEASSQTGTTTPLPTVSPWMYFQDTNSYYKVYTMNDTWNGYERRCAEEGGNLSTIHSMRENDFLNTFITYAPDCWYMGLGLRAAPPGQLHFFWIDGSPKNFTNWKPDLSPGGTPSNLSVIIPPKDQQGYLNAKWTDDDFHCGFLNFYDGRWTYFRCTMYFSLFCGVCKRPAA